MVLYAVLILLCQADLKIAVRASVIIMTFTSLFGLATKTLFGSLQPGVFENWLAAAPNLVVILGASRSLHCESDWPDLRPCSLYPPFASGQFFWTLSRTSGRHWD